MDCFDTRMGNSICTYRNPQILLNLLTSRLQKIKNLLLIFRMKSVSRKAINQSVNHFFLPDSVTHVHFSYDIQKNNGIGNT